MRKQDKLREYARITKAKNQEWNYYNMAQVINITVQAFYNWLYGAYELSNTKAQQLESLLNDLSE